MYVNPRHPNPPRQPGPPIDEGTELATIRRKDGHELRIRMKSYNGNPYVSIQLWSIDPQGNAWPVKGRSSSIRLNEIDEVVEGLKAAFREARETTRRQGQMEQRHDDQAEQPDRRQEQPANGAVRPPWESGNFDEFADS